MKTIAVLGCGLVGSLIARDLARDRFEVIAADVSDQALSTLEGIDRISLRRADLSSRSEIEEVVRDADVVVGAVPGRLGFAMLSAVIGAGKPVADISFSPENPLDLDGAARAKNVTVVVDAGVSPGLSNLAVGRAAARLASIERAVIYVGGLPVARFWPWEYRIVFSATDVIEEYTRPARLIEEGKLVVKPALSEPELLDFPGIGTLEAFNSDGLRTLLETVPATNMKEKTLRYPGHAEKMRMLRESRFFSEAPVTVGGRPVVPRELTEKLLFDSWKRAAGEEELTVLRVTVAGHDQQGKARRYLYELFDRTDRATGATSMARTTGFPCAIIAGMLADGNYRDPGVKPLELLASNDAVYEQLLAGLRARGVAFTEEEAAVEAS